MRGAEEIINEDTEGSCGQGQSLAWMRLCPCADGKDGLLRFPSGGRGRPGMSPDEKPKSFSPCVGSQRRRAPPPPAGSQAEL